MLWKRSPFCSLSKSKKVLFSVYHRFVRERTQLSSLSQEQFKSELTELQRAILQKDRTHASLKAQTLLNLANIHLKKNLFMQFLHFSAGIVGALIIAIVIRQTCFELYEIPTGSMRPTFREHDRLMVTKTAFGINVPLMPKHLYFNPDLVQRNSVVVFTVENMDFRDGDTVYFYLFPGKKLLIKRLLGKPGDTLYFYGGNIYGIDRYGYDISKELQNEALAHIEHIPFIHFEGKMETAPSSIPGISSPVIIKQMNQAIARLYTTSMRKTVGELLPKITAQDPSIKYHNLWGYEHFASARLLTKEQVQRFSDQELSELVEAPLYLELKHHPSLENARLGIDERNRVRPMIGLSTSIIPLQEFHVKEILNQLYTSRFIIKKGFAYRYGTSDHNHTSFAPYLPGIPDGTYEFYFGKAYKVSWQGYTIELPHQHPLYNFDLAHIQSLFNAGIEFDNRFFPQSREQTLRPARYAYFRNGDLYLMGKPILTKNDPVLKDFIAKELQKQHQAPHSKPYYPFVDLGAPIDASGHLKLDIIQKFGLKIPEHSYLVLGDNHANSGDSREFGFVPEENLRGIASFIFSPPGQRFGAPVQPATPWFNQGRFVVWTLLLIGTGGWYWYQRRRFRLPLEL